MSYLAKLKVDISGKAIPSELTKPTKAPSVSFVSVTSGHISEIEGANEPLPDPAAEARRQRVLTMLAERPSIRYAVSVDSPDRNPVILALGIRDQATCEIHVRRDKFDPFKLIDLIERHGSTLHK